MYFVYDLETRSECDLIKCGSAEYARHNSTQVFCVSWSYSETKDGLKEAQVKSWSPVLGGDKEELLEKLLDPEVILVAHNASFERAITRFVLSRVLKEPRLRELGPERFICTASMASALALPRSLEGACSVLGLSAEKDMDGRRLILKYTKPRKATKNDTSKWHSDLNDLKRIIHYCENDVRAEVELFLKAKPLSEFERKVWVLDQNINERGIAVDRELVLAALELIEKEKDRIEKETQKISKGAIPSTTQRDLTLSWLEAKGVKLPNLQAGTIREWLKKNETPLECAEILRLRQSASKASTAKYQAFEARSRSDGYSRDNLIYHGASTGRYSASGIQLQNLPKAKTKDTDHLARLIKEKDLELLRLLYGDPMQAMSDALRSCIIPSVGHELYVADYASIEVRVLFWLASHANGAEAFLNGRDLYKEMAAIIFKKKADDVTNEERALGKAAILGCGYSMGAAKFFETCKTFGIAITEELAKESVEAYRKTHAPVVALWKKLGDTAIACVQNKKKYLCGKVAFFLEGDFLKIELPSGRHLSYFKPEIKNELTPWGDMRPVLYSWATNGLTRKWERYKNYSGLICENITQAVARDLMVEAMLRIEDAGYKILVSVHDELISEKEIGEGNIDEYCSLMSQLPSWANGCPVKTEGWKGIRYRK
jgi:DNA polymerase